MLLYPNKSTYTFAVYIFTSAPLALVPKTNVPPSFHWFTPRPHLHYIVPLIRCIVSWKRNRKPCDYSSATLHESCRSRRQWLWMRVTSAHFLTTSSSRSLFLCQYSPGSLRFITLCFASVACDPALLVSLVSWHCRFTTKCKAYTRCKYTHAKTPVSGVLKTVCLLWRVLSSACRSGQPSTTVNIPVMGKGYYTGQPLTT